MHFRFSNIAKGMHDISLALARGYFRLLVDTDEGVSSYILVDYGSERCFSCSSVYDEYGFAALGTPLG